MAYRTLNSSSYRKAQFFVLSAVFIVITIFLMSQWLEPYTITDTSSIIFEQEFFIFNNIKEKAVETVKISKNCEDLNYNLDEFKNFAIDFAFRNGMSLNLTYNIISPCKDNERKTYFFIELRTPNSLINSSFFANATGSFKQ